MPLNITNEQFDDDDIEMIQDNNGGGGGGVPPMMSVLTGSRIVPTLDEYLSQFSQIVGRVDAMLISNNAAPPPTSSSSSDPSRLFPQMLEYMRIASELEGTGDLQGALNNYGLAVFVLYSVINANPIFLQDDSTRVLLMQMAVFMDMKVRNVLDMRNGMASFFVTRDELEKLRSSVTSTEDKSPQFEIERFEDLPNGLSDIIGLEETKRQIVDILTGSENINLLFHGPPGTGKTTIARAVAKTYKFDVMFLTVSDLVGGYVGQTARNIQEMFDRATEYTSASATTDRRRRPRNLYIIIDEAESVLVDRNSSDNAEYAGGVSTFLANTSDLSQRPFGFIIITNLRENIDSAVRRRLNEIFVGWMNAAQFVEFLAESLLKMGSAVSVEDVENASRILPANMIEFTPALANIMISHMRSSTLDNIQDFFFTRLTDDDDRSGDRDLFSFSSLNSPGAITYSELVAELGRPPLNRNLKFPPISVRDVTVAFEALARGAIVPPK